MDRRRRGCGKVKIPHGFSSPGLVMGLHLLLLVQEFLNSNSAKHLFSPHLNIAGTTALANPAVQRLDMHAQSGGSFFGRKQCFHTELIRRKRFRRIFVVYFRERMSMVPVTAVTDLRWFRLGTIGLDWLRTNRRRSFAGFSLFLLGFWPEGC